MKIGFTGTQDGMTTAQREALMSIFDQIREPSELHHGDCIGSDAEAHSTAAAFGIKRVCHPPDSPTKRAFCKCEVTLPEKPYLARNHDIVDATDMLIATPKSDQEELRSGTWATIRYARKLKRAIYIIQPNGVIKTENLT